MAFPDTDLQVQILAYLGADPTASSGSWPAATDLSSRLLDGSLRITRGRSAGQTTLSSGSCTFDLNNTDGALTPLMATSPYYGDWDVGTPVAVNVTGVGASPPYGRFRGYIADLTQTFVPGVGDANISVVRVTLGGKARQLTQGSVEKSAMRRYYDNVSPQPAAYWPLESGDQRAMFSFESPLAGVADLAVIPTTSFGVTRPFAAAGGISPGPLGAASATDTSAGGRLSGAVPLVSSATTARGELSMLANGYENTFPGIISMYNGTTASDGSATRIGVAAQDLGSGWQVGVLWIGPTANSGVYAPGVTLLQDNQWHLIQLDLSSAGGGADTSYVLRIDGTTILSGTATGYGWLPITKVDTNTLATDIDRQAHISVWSGTSLPTASDAYQAFLAYSGEAAHTRFNRVCTEDAVPHTTTATASRALGPQAVGDTVAILQDAETGDHGMLYELANDWGFGYLASRQRTNLTAALTVDLSTYRTSDDSSNVLTPVRNDSKLRNEWTVSTPDGRAATAADTGNRSKRGRYDDSGNANISTTVDLLSEASWRVHEGTYDGLRYRTMPIDVGANPASPSNLLTPWLAMDLGQRIDRTNNPTPEHPYDGTTLILQGYTETLTHKTWKVDAVVEPYEPWRVMNVANASPDLSEFLGRAAGDAACAIRTDITSSTTSIPFDPTWFRWTTTASHFSTSNWPAMQVRLKKAPGIAGGGEVVTVSAISTTAATFVAVGTPAHADNAAVTPALYAGGQAGDLILVVAAPRGSASLATPAGYQNIIHGTIFVFAKRHTGSESAPTITPSGGASGDTLSAFTFGLRNMPAIPALADLVRIDPPDASGSSTQNIPFAGATPPDAGSVVLLLAWKGDDYTSVAPPAGFTEMVEASTTVGNDQSLYAAYQIQTTPTVVQPGTIVVTGGAAANTYCLTVVLAGGFQTATVTRSANGVSKAHSAGTLFALEHPLIQAL